MIAYISVLVMVVDIHYASLTTGISVLIMMAASVDTHDGSMDTVDWFRICFENV